MRIIKRKNNTKQLSKNIFSGNSMGGYAAILFGCFLSVDTVISFAPQIFINRYNRFINVDSRWPNEISKIYNYPENRPEFFDLKKCLS